ncbi:hypothetical protein BCV72DRAFT_307080 [Rhizopus microsporus var. microsporus]|uniref:Uncharacterized protein n=1 Tax=Rhizopus microsporus var. microsporus TaxID=86635 RepID=A0A1X0QY72_RHIZD|nr:hypothetical protein BCV72DRAFT_307080 [Rhizopus microsporus var. microsporus]
MHANWSLRSSTFENYYYKPHDQHKRGREMANKLFGDVTKNRITSEVGMEPTTIVVGTTGNSNVGEMKTKDMVTCPKILSATFKRDPEGYNHILCLRFANVTISDAPLGFPLFEGMLSNYPK